MNRCSCDAFTAYGDCGHLASASETAPTPSHEALAAARAWLDDSCKSGGNCNCAACEQSFALALDAFARERTKYWQQLAAALQDELNLTVPREKREAVEAVLRAALALQSWQAIALADALDRLAGREVGETLKRVRGTDAG